MIPGPQFMAEAVAAAKAGNQARQRAVRTALNPAIADKAGLPTADSRDPGQAPRSASPAQVSRRAQARPGAREPTGRLTAGRLSSFRRPEFQVPPARPVVPILRAHCASSDGTATQVQRGGDRRR
jgi:hypothetical protein